MRPNGPSEFACCPSLPEVVCPRSVLAPGRRKRWRKILPATEDRATGSATDASPHFQIASDTKLPLGVVSDLAAVFEDSRVAVRALPLSLDALPESRSKSRCAFCRRMALQVEGP